MYSLTSPLQFDPLDSGSDTYQVVYRSAPGNTQPVVVSGGILVDGFDCSSGMCSATVPAWPEGQIARQFYVDDVRAVRARSNYDPTASVQGANSVYARADFGYEVPLGGWAPPLSHPEWAEVVTVTHRNAGRFTKEDFTIRLAESEVICPAGETASIHALGSVAHFPASACRPCSLRSKCTVATSGRGRSIAIHEHEDLLLELRAFRKTPQGRAALRERTAIEHRLARIGAIQGPRARYKGARKNTLDVRRCAAINNLQALRNAA